MKISIQCEKKSIRCEKASNVIKSIQREKTFNKDDSNLNIFVLQMCVLLCCCYSPDIYTITNVHDMANAYLIFIIIIIDKFVHNMLCLIIYVVVCFDIYFFVYNHTYF